MSVSGEQAMTVDESRLLRSWLFVGLVVVGCGRGASTVDSGSQPPFDAGVVVDAGGADAGATDAGDSDAGREPEPDAGSGCKGLAVDAAAVKRESVARLRAFFGVTSGFENGELYFRDLAGGIPSCPIYDFAALVYAAPIAPPLLPPDAERALASYGTEPVVEYQWGINGHRLILFNVKESDIGKLPLRQLHPLSFVGLLNPNVSVARANQIAAELTMLSGPAPVDVLDAIGIITCGPRVDDDNSLDIDGLTEGPYRTGVLAAIEHARQLPDFDSIDWSGMNYAYDLDEEPVRLLDDGTLCVEELGVVRGRQEKAGLIFASKTSLPPPFGAGWVNNPEVSRCGP